MKVGLFNVKGSIQERNQFFTTSKSIKDVGVISCTDSTLKKCDWTQTPEWAVVKDGLIKDQAIIQRVSTETGVSARQKAATGIFERRHTKCTQPTRYSCSLD